MTEKSNYVWRFQNLNDLVPDDYLVESIHRVFLNGFGLAQGWSHEGIKNAFKRSTVIGLLLGSEKHLCGYSMYTIPDEPLLGSYFLWEDAICLKKEAQGYGLSLHVWNMAAQLFPNRKYGWLGGRTQNPLVIKRYAKMGNLFPFASTYADGDGKLLMDYLRAHVAEVRDVKQLDQNHGICHGVYQEGRLGDYSGSVPETIDLDKRLSEWGLQREKGDAVIIVAKLTNLIVSS